MVIFILWEIIIISLFINQIELKRKVLFYSSVFTLSVNTIPENETDYLFDSSSDEMIEEIDNLSSENNHISQENSPEEILISNKSKIDLRLDVASDNIINETSKDVDSNLIEVVDIGIQTQLSDFEKVIHSKIEKDIRAKADLLEFGTEQNIDSRELISKAVQTKPDLHIDLSSIPSNIDKEITANSVLNNIPLELMDPLLLEAYLPVPDLINVGYYLAFANGTIC